MKLHHGVGACQRLLRNHIEVEHAGIVDQHLHAAALTLAEVEDLLRRICMRQVGI